ncbi:MAG: BatD family protein [Spirochaetales bacterium]|nr:BatD family protein [Spirochaetales bacterium]
MNRKRTLLIALVALIAVSYGAAQDVRVTISSKEGFVGLPLDYQITINGSKKAEVPTLVGFDDFDVTYQGQSQSSSTTIINGQRTTSVTVKYVWKLLPLREGKLTIPSFPVIVDGEEFMTPAGEILISPPREIEGFKLILTPDNDKVYMGQSVRVNMDFYFSSSIGGLDFTLPGKISGSREGEDFRILESAPPSQSSNDIRKITIDDRTFYGTISSRVEGGSQYTILSVPLDIMPLRGGPIELEGASVAFTAERGSWPRNYSEDLVIPSRGSTLTAENLPPPIEDSPNGILLATGELKAHATLSAETARPGDPLTLTVRLEGLARPETCEIPALEDFSSLEEEFSLPTDRSRPKAEGNSLTITQTVRPESVETQGIPSMEFVYFDLNAEAVKRVSTQFIPLAMTSAGNVSLSDVESFDGDSPLTGLRENDRGIRQNKGIEELNRGDLRGRTFMGTFAFRLLFLFPPLGFFLFLLGLGITKILSEKKSRDNKDAFRQLNKALLAKDDDFFAAFERYLRERLFQGRSFVKAELEGRAVELQLEELSSLYGHMEKSRYAGGDGQIEGDAILKVAEELEKRL